MKRSVEAAYPLAVGVLFGAAWWCAGPALPIDEKEFLAAAISLGAVLTGFIATAKAILATLPSESVMRQLRASGYVNDLVDYLAQALYGCLLFSVISLAGFFFLAKDRTPPLNEMYGGLWVGLGIFALLSFHRVSSLLFKIIKSEPVA